MDVCWLFKNHRAHCSRKQLLDYLIEQAEKEGCDDGRDALIESMVFARRAFGEPGQTRSQSSKTEYIALNVDAEREKIQKDYERSLHQWKKERTTLEFYILLYDSILGALTEEERALLVLHYQDGYSMEMISQIPLTEHSPGPRSKSTLRRMIQKIIEKAQEIAEIQIGKI